MILENPNITKNMIKILEEVRKYVPTHEVERYYTYKGRSHKYKDAALHPILFGGDQLTATRARAAKLAKISETDASSHIDGIVPTNEDWHCRMTLLTVRTTVRALIFAGLNFRGFRKFAIFVFLFSRVPIQCLCFFCSS